jgi:hypothetical protein
MQAFMDFHEHAAALGGALDPHPAPIRRRSPRYAGLSR